MSNNKESKNYVTKELALAVTPIAAAYLFMAFYQSGFCGYYGIPVDLISIDLKDILLGSRITLLAAVLAFLWIALYYNIIPNANSALFKAIITLILIFSLWLGFTFGNFDAKNKTQYLVSKTTPESVVLKIYDTNMITAPFDRTTKIVKKEFSVHQIGEQPIIAYHLENIGALTPQ